MAIDAIEEPDAWFVTFLHDRIYEFNVEATGFDDGRSLAFVEHDGSTVVGGLHGWTWGRSAWVDVLWVDARARRRGLGGRLLEAAEREAVRRSCLMVALSTHSFQARDFYVARGYESVSYLDGYPFGHGQYLMRKPLTPVTSASP